MSFIVVLGASIHAWKCSGRHLLQWKGILPYLMQDLLLCAMLIPLGDVEVCLTLPTMRMMTNLFRRWQNTLVSVKISLALQINTQFAS
jgi:hypothetical protein